MRTLNGERITSRLSSASMTRFAPPEPVSRSSLQRCALTRYPRFISSTTRLVGIITREYKVRGAQRCAAKLPDALSGPGLRGSRFCAAMRERPEGREKHFVRAQLRGENALQHKSLDQRVNHTDQMRRGHRQVALFISHCTEPLRAKLVTGGGDVTNARAQIRVAKRVGHACQTPPRSRCSVRDRRERRFGHCVHHLGERRARFNPWRDRSPVGLPERDEQLLAVLEVPVDRTGSHAGPTCNRFERGAGVAKSSNQRRRRFE